MVKEEILKHFGLTEAEANVYLILLQIGEATASEIAKRTNMNRTFTYDRLKKLLDAGMVSYVVKENKKYFKASEPSHLLSILKDKEEEVRGILPELEKLRQPIKLGPEVEVYSGIKGVKTALNLMLKEKQDVYLHGTYNKFKETLPLDFEIWDKRRIKQRIKMKVLSSEPLKLEMGEVDLLPEEEQSLTSNFTFGNRSITVLWSDYPVAILIKSDEVARNNILFFNAIWNREVKIYSGISGIQMAFMELLENTKEFTGFGYNKQLADVYTVKFSDEWHLDRIKKKITARIISYDDKASRDYFSPRKKSKKLFYVRSLPKELQGPACISLSDQMIATFVYTEKKFRVVVNKNKETVKVYKGYFEELWKKAHIHDIHQRYFFK